MEREDAWHSGNSTKESRGRRLFLEVADKTGTDGDSVPSRTPPPRQYNCSLYLLLFRGFVFLFVFDFGSGKELNRTLRVVWLWCWFKVWS